MDVNDDVLGLANVLADRVARQHGLATDRAELTDFETWKMLRAARVHALSRMGGFGGSGWRLGRTNLS